MEIERFRCRQRKSLLGGAVLLSVIVLASLAGALALDFQAWVARHQHIFATTRLALLQEIRDKQVAILHAGLMLGAIGGSDHTRLGPKPPLLLHAGPERQPALFMGGRPPQEGLHAHAAYAHIWHAQGAPCSSVAPESSQVSVGGDALLCRLLHPPVLVHAMHPIWWYGNGLLDGEDGIELMMPLVRNGQLLALLAGKLSMQEIEQHLPRFIQGGNLVVLGHDEQPVLSRLDPGEPTMLARLARKRSDSAISLLDIVRTGTLSIRAPLGASGWTLSYASSWHKLLAARGPTMLAWGGGALLMLLLVWGSVVRQMRQISRLPLDGRSAPLSPSCLPADTLSPSTTALAPTRESPPPQVLATVGHEIRVSLNGILGHLELLGETALGGRQRDRLRQITDCSQSLLQVVDDVLDYSRLEAGCMASEEIGFDLVELVEQVLEMGWPQAEHKGLRLFYQIAPELAGRFGGDPLRLRQILSNLVGNAIKFTQHGKVCVEVRHDGVRPDGRQLLALSIADTGVGMSSAELQKVFQPYEQAHAAVARMYGGSGLGLALCRRLARLLGGTIAAVSAAGQGSVFTVRLPLVSKAGGQRQPAVKMPPAVALVCDAPEWRAYLLPLLDAWRVDVRQLSTPRQWQPWHGPLLLFGATRAWSHAAEQDARVRGCCIIDAMPGGPREPVLGEGRLDVSCFSQSGLAQALARSLSPALSPALAHDVVSCSGQRVLIVDNHPINRFLLAEQLQHLGCRPEVAGTAQDALRMMEHTAYDMVFSDLSMPGIDGYRFAALLRADGYRCPIIAFTGHVDKKVRRACNQAGIDMVLRKPLSMRRLASAVGLRMPAGCHRQSLATSQEGRCSLTREMVQVLRTSTETSLLGLRCASAQRRHDDALSHLHSIKGAFAMQRELRVVALCRAMESAWRESVPGDASERIAHLSQLLAMVCMRFDAIVGEPEDRMA